MRLDPPAAASRAARLPLLDAARGLAVLAMVVYHFCWDLRYFGYHRLRRGSRLRLAHLRSCDRRRVSLHRRRQPGPLDPSRLQRSQISPPPCVLVAAAAAITLVTYFIFPDSYIFFGVLHHIAVASVLGLAFLRLPVWLVIAASIACFLAPWFLASPIFDSPWLIWVGLQTEFPRTNDFVPMLPWFGVVLAGIAAARLWPMLAPQALPHFRFRRASPAHLDRAPEPPHLPPAPAGPFRAVYLATEIDPPDFSRLRAGLCRGLHRFLHRVGYRRRYLPRDLRASPSARRPRGFGPGWSGRA